MKNHKSPHEDAAATVEVVVAVVGRAHGIGGEMTVQVRTDEPDRRLAVGEQVRQEGTHTVWSVAGFRWHSGRALVRLSGVNDRSEAEQLRGTVLVADVPGDAVPDDPEEFYDRDLIGLVVRDHTDTPVGVVAEVMHLPMQDLLVVETSWGERLVPLTHQVVPLVDIASRYCVVADVPGLLSELPSETPDAH